MSAIRYGKKGFICGRLAVFASVAALIIFVTNGKVLYPLGLAAAVFYIAGHYIGSGMVVNNGRKIVRPVVLIVRAIFL